MNIYGASGHGKVILDIIRSVSSEEIDFVIDDNPEIEEFAGKSVFHKLTSEVLNCETVFAIGKNRIRKKLSQDFKGPVASAIVHSSAVLSDSAKLGKGTVVMANAAINAAVAAGEHCIINTAAVVEHDVVLGDFVHISPGAVITGNVHIGEGTHIGAGAVIIPGIKIGKWVSVGAGAVIIRDIPDFAIVVGNPGKLIKYKSDENE
ncbi:MAG: acetyltransferase [Salegentibacter sp.]